MYSTADELKLLLSEKELIQLASDGRAGQWTDGSVQAVLTEAIGQADSEINGYLSMVPGALPIVTVPDLVNNLSEKIAAYNLLRRRPSVPDHWQSEYKRCIDLLKWIVEKGKLPWQPVSGGDEAATIDPGQVVVVSREREW